MTFRKKPLVFIVEDNEAFRTLISRVIQSQGYKVMLFEHGRKALEMLNYIKPAIIVSDIEMPCMNGFELNKSVKNRFGDYKIPFIYLSSTNSDKTKKKADKLGAIPMPNKPVALQELSSRIKEVLSNSVYQV